MPIQVLTHEDQKGLEALARDYSRQINDGIIRPELITELVIEGFYGARGIIVAKSFSGNIEAILSYELFMPENVHEFELEFPKLAGEQIVNRCGRAYKNTPPSLFIGLRNYTFDEALAWLGLIESFRKGMGSKLVETFKSLPNIEGIFVLFPTDAVDFYKKLGFRKSGLYVADDSNPIMVWMESGKY